MISSATMGGWTVARPPCFVVSEKVPDRELGESLVEAADACEYLNVPASDEVREKWKSEVLAAVGVRDWGSLERGSKLVGVERELTRWTISPYLRRRAGGWLPPIDPSAPATRVH